jgi:hypothetical protein
MAEMGDKEYQALGSKRGWFKPPGFGPKSLGRALEFEEYADRAPEEQSERLGGFLKEAAEQVAEVAKGGEREA